MMILGIHIHISLRSCVPCTWKSGTEHHQHTYADKDGHNNGRFPVITTSRVCSRVCLTIMSLYQMEKVRFQLIAHGQRSFWQGFVQYGP